MEKYFESKTVKKVILVIGILIIALLIFQAGIFFGYRKAGYSYRSGDNFHRAFEGRRPGMIGLPNPRMEREFSNSHGASGSIVTIELPAIVLADQEGVEKIIVISKDTVIRRGRDTIKSTDLRVNDFAVIIGSPDSKGEIGAQLVRVLPAPSDFLMGTTSKPR